MRRRVLIVVSSYRPAMLADMQRARMLAWELPALGWDVEILTPAAAEVRGDVLEDDPAAFFSPGETIHEVGSLLRQAFELAGSRSPAWRTWWPMHRRGLELLRTGRFDLVYFSTTTFGYFLMGPRWRRETGVPYVLDLHDPWVREGARAGLSLRLERAAAADADGLVSVSPRYLETFRKRYAEGRPAWLAAGRSAVIPFGALESDLRAAAASRRGSDGRIVAQYTGAGGTIMARSFGVICGALARLREEGNPLAERLRLRLHGTVYGWKPGDAKVLQTVAERFGVGDLVEELPERVSYRRSLELLLESDGAVILGVDDPGYAPSKLVGCALAGKPLLACLREESPARAAFEAAPSMGEPLWFGEKGQMPADDAARALHRFLTDAAERRAFDRRAELEPLLARGMARRHSELFRACLRTEAGAA